MSASVMPVELLACGHRAQRIRRTCFQCFRVVECLVCHRCGEESVGEAPVTARPGPVVTLSAPSSQPARAAHVEEGADELTDEGHEVVDVAAEAAEQLKEFSEWDFTPPPEPVPAGEPRSGPKDAAIRAEFARRLEKALASVGEKPGMRERFAARLELALATRGDAATPVPHRLERAMAVEPPDGREKSTGYPSVKAKRKMSAAHKAAIRKGHKDRKKRLAEEAKAAKA